MTRDWARESGLVDVADAIALADVTVDAENPARASVSNFTRHFAPWAYLWAGYHFWRAVRLQSPESLGHALHSVQDAAAHGLLGLAHVRNDLNFGRDPDDWDAAPERLKVFIRERSLRLLRRYRDSV
ncbi:MAG: hypothetical protein Q8S43_05265 [Actinomycetota bacterium]|nr:hypothetical protein [Actinomycetota bacterium]